MYTSKFSIIQIFMKFVCNDPLQVYESQFVDWKFFSLPDKLLETDAITSLFLSSTWYQTAQSPSPLASACRIKGTLKFEWAKMGDSEQNLCKVSKASLLCWSPVHLKHFLSIGGTLQILKKLIKRFGNPTEIGDKSPMITNKS